MPADGEFRFADFFKQMFFRELHKANKSECVQNGVINGLMMFIAGYTAGYAYYYSPKKAVYVFGLPAFAFTAVATVIICDTNNAVEKPSQQQHQQQLQQQIK
ncbi:uncharacterized protein LOC132718524 [Ruditapes philippinarum]|uniref:uncharacterized protein LOC132718524 n=1 Tax=Ruditapes philippinarum TaxID=129788 RepID=UPI00295BCE01|nr:uncharacterized protein LOC132718524 [Ruditapes philippinarum]